MAGAQTPVSISGTVIEAVAVVLPAPPAEAVEVEAAVEGAVAVALPLPPCPPPARSILQAFRPGPLRQQARRIRQCRQGRQLITQHTRWF